MPISNYCLVKTCKNTEVNSDKIFIYVPKEPNLRRKWLRAAGKEEGEISMKSNVAVCEDHFDLSTDMKNYFQYKMVGGRKMMKKNVIPHKNCFPIKCEENKVPETRLDETMPSTSQTIETPNNEQEHWNQQFETVMIKNEVVTEDECENEKKVEFVEREVKQEELDISCDCVDHDMHKSEISANVAKKSMENDSKSEFHEESSQELSKRSGEFQKRDYKCDDCPAEFTNYHNLRSHAKVHSGEGLLSCGHCDRKFTCISGLKSHARTHVADKLHICHICRKTFTKTTNLIEHERTHILAPYVCNVCHKEFTQDISLQMHKRIHEEEKPFGCNVCDYKCVQFEDLTSHLQIHVKEKPHVCTVCKKRYTNLFNLKTHMRIHTREKPYACDYKTASSNAEVDIQNIEVSSGNGKSTPTNK